jgi:HD-like signal output (HDOD) protein
MEKLNELPPLSNAARKILEIIYNPDIDIAVFVEVVEQDPVLLGKLIGLANSAYYGNRKVTSAERAIIDILGLRTAKNIALGVVLSGIFDTRQCPDFNVSEYWLNSLLSARLAREFAQFVSEIEADEAYLCAMLYEIGQMALAFLYPEAMNQILAEDEALRLSREIETFGSNHYAVSAALLDKWHLPETVVHVLKESSVTDNTESSKMTRLIRLCKQLSSELLASPVPAELQQEQSPELSSYPLPDFLQPFKTELESAIKKTAAKLSEFKEMAQLLS